MAARARSSQTRATLLEAAASRLKLAPQRKSSRTAISSDKRGRGRVGEKVRERQLHNSVFMNFISWLMLQLITTSAEFRVFWGEAPEDCGEAVKNKDGTKSDS